MKVLFGLEAGSHAGLGHVMRCLPLARELVGRGVETMLGLYGDAPAESLPLAGAVTGPMKQAPVGPKGPARCLVDLCREHRPDWLVVDGYHFDLQRLFAVQHAHGGRLFVQDDLGGAITGDVICNPNTDRSDLYPDTSARLLLGPRYAVMDEAYAHTVWRAQKHERCRRVLVSFGGLDGKDWTGAALAALAALDVLLDVDVVLGPFVPAGRTYPERMGRLEVRVLRGLTNLAQAMAETDLMVSGAGSTVWQACAVGVALCCVQVVDNQRFIFESVQAANAAVCFRPEDAPTSERARRFGEHVAGCLDFTARKRLGENARALCDGLGSRRVADYLTQGEGKSS